MFYCHYMLSVFVATDFEFRRLGGVVGGRPSFPLVNEKTLAQESLTAESDDVVATLHQRS